MSTRETAATCWCGAAMKVAGVGAYPYDCRAKDLWPHDMVYIGCEAGHSGWSHGPVVAEVTQ